MFAVIENDQQVLALQIFQQGFADRSRGFFTNSNCSGNGLIHQLRLRDGREFHNANAVRKIKKQLLRHLQGQPRLSNASGAG